MWFRILIKRRWNSYAILHIYTFYIPLWYINRLINVENNRMLSLINILNYHLYLFYQFISPSELVPHPSFLIFQSINLFICFVTRNYHSVLNYRLIETIGTVFIFFILFQSYKFVLLLFFVLIFYSLLVFTDMFLFLDFLLMNHHFLHIYRIYEWFFLLILW